MRSQIGVIISPTHRVKMEEINVPLPVLLGALPKTLARWDEVKRQLKISMIDGNDVGVYEEIYDELSTKLHSAWKDDVGTVLARDTPSSVRCVKAGTGYKETVEQRRRALDEHASHAQHIRDAEKYGFVIKKVTPPAFPPFPNFIHETKQNVTNKYITLTVFSMYSQAYEDLYVTGIFDAFSSPTSLTGDERKEHTRKVLRIQPCWVSDEKVPVYLMSDLLHTYKASSPIVPIYDLKPILCRNSECTSSNHSSRDRTLTDTCAIPRGDPETLPKGGSGICHDILCVNKHTRSDYMTSECDKSYVW